MPRFLASVFFFYLVTEIILLWHEKKLKNESSCAVVGSKFANFLSLSLLYFFGNRYSVVKTLFCCTAPSSLPFYMY